MITTWGWGSEAITTVGWGGVTIEVVVPTPDFAIIPRYLFVGISFCFRGL
jgi:hypothetical protein